MGQGRGSHKKEHGISFTDVVILVSWPMAMSMQAGGSFVTSSQIDFGISYCPLSKLLTGKAREMEMCKIIIY